MKDPHSVVFIMGETILFGISGLIIGRLVDKFFDPFYKKYASKQIYKLALTILQIACLGLIVAVIYIYISPIFAEKLQVSLSGMAFPSFYFGSQKNIYKVWFDFIKAEEDDI